MAVPAPGKPLRPFPSAGRDTAAVVRTHSAPGPDRLTLARARRMSASGRAVTGWMVVLYAASLVAAAASLDSWHPTVASTAPVKLARLKQLMKAAPDQPLLVMLGSSRTDSLFVARRFCGIAGPEGRGWQAFNLGVPGIGSIHELIYLREMLDAAIRPRLLLVEFQTTLLNDPRNGFASEERGTTAGWRSLREMRRMLPYFCNPRQQCAQWLLARFLPAYMFRCWLTDELLGGPSATQVPRWDEWTDAWGFHLPDWPTAAECARRLAYTCREFRDGLQHFRVAEGPSQATRDLLQLCRRQHIPVVLVLPPESSLLRSWYAPEGLADMDRLLAELHATYQVPILDAREWLADSDFHDGHHALAQGANRFTSQLLEALRPLLQGSHAGVRTAPSTPSAAPEPGAAELRRR